MLIRHDFGPKGVEYVRSYLQANEQFGKRLGRLLLTHHNIDAGDAWALVPADSSIERRTAFESGGLFPKRDHDWDHEVGQWIDGELTQPAGRQRLLCIENAFARSGDGWLETHPDHQAFFCGDDVYTYATAEKPQADLAGWLGGATWRPDIGIVTVLPHAGWELTNRQSLSPTDVEKLAIAAAAIIVGAWDDEGFFFWQPSSTQPVNEGPGA